MTLKLGRDVDTYTERYALQYPQDGSMKDQMFGVCFVYLGPNADLFDTTFSAFGHVVLPR